MTTFDTARMGARSTGGAFAQLVARIAAWNDARVTRAALNKLSDRELDDIGLSRGEIDEIR